MLGAGYIGGAIARTAVAHGHQIWCVRRAAAADADGITWLRGDLATGAIDGLPGSLDAIVLSVAPSRGDDAYERVYPPAARTAVAVAGRVGARALVYTSSTGVYGGRDGVEVTEASPRAGAGAANAALIEAEDLILTAPVPSVTVLRIAGIYGPGRDPRARMRDADGLAQRGEYWVNLAHRDDIVAAALLALRLPEGRRAVNVSDGSPTRAADVARWLASERGVDPAALSFGNDGSRARNDQRVSNAMLCSLGWHATYPSFREGFLRGL